MLISETSAGINAGIAQNRYEAALNTAAIQKTIVEEAQKSRDLITGNRMADMQSQINRLERDVALCGIPRVQPNYVYSAVPVPFGNLGLAQQYQYYPAA